MVSKKTLPVAKYELLRPAGPMEVMFGIYQDNKFQNNHTMTATYNRPLTRANLFHALKTVVENIPALSLTAVNEPSSKKGQTVCHEARLKSIDLEDSVEFLQEEQLHSTLTSQIHNRNYFSPQGRRWKLVISGRHVIFVWDHFIGDGLSGYAFHQALLHALQNTRSLTSPMTSTAVPIPITAPYSYWYNHYPHGLSYLTLILNFIRVTLMRLFFPTRYQLFSDAHRHTRPFSLASPLSPPPETCVTTIRIPATTQSRILAACRKNGTTFTALLQTLVMVTLTTEIYTEAKVGFSALPVSMRNFTSLPKEEIVFANFAGSYDEIQFLGKYRDAGKADAGSASKGNEENCSAAPLDSEKIWALAAAYKARLTKAIKSGKVVQGALGLRLMGDTREEFWKNGIMQLSKFRRHLVQISNLGPFDPNMGSDAGEPERPVAMRKDGMEKDGMKKDFGEKGAVVNRMLANKVGMEVEVEKWSIVGMEFSQSVVDEQVGTIGPVLSVSGVKGGEVVVNASFQEGVLEREVVESILSGVERRLLYIAEIKDKDS